MANQEKDKKLLSVVVPVFNEKEVLDAFYKRIKNVGESLNSMNFEVLFVDDGSKDGSYQKLMDYAVSDENVKVIKFSRNFGHQVAITAGIDNAKGDAVVVIDADLQDPPEVITEFIEKWKEGYDVVYGVRERREGEGRLKLFTASLFYRVLKKLTHVEIPVDVGDFRLMSKQSVKVFKELREKDRFVRGLVSWLGFKQTGVYYHRDKRYAGETKYPLRKMIRFAIDGITSFSGFPLKLATWFGAITTIFAFAFMIIVITGKFMGYTIQGWASVMLSVLFLGGVQLICLGIVGEYIARIFEQIKQRPLYIIEEIIEEIKMGKNS
ncbi:MAG: glycosyltransferase family 2 protein [Candidatus Scalindua sp.]|nr:glycosyltransferase family 2 protein [Candidatus Scalindua sp.]